MLATAMAMVGALQASQPARTEISRTCANSLSERVAQIARNTYPDSLPVSRRIRGRTVFLIERRWQYFDIDHDNKFSFSEYLSYEWSTYLAFSAPKRCIMTKAQFFSMSLGDPEGAGNGWSLPAISKVVTHLYNEMDPSGRGFLDEGAIVPRARRTFVAMDRDRNGYLSPTELK